MLNQALPFHVSQALPYFVLPLSLHRLAGGWPGHTPYLSNFGRSNAKLSPPTTQNHTEGAPGSFCEPGSWVSGCSFSRVNLEGKLVRLP
jgi:hypothetical protein